MKRQTEGAAVLSYHLQPGKGDEGEGDGGDAFYLDYYALVFLDALDDAFHTLKVAFGDAHFLARLCYKLHVFKVDEAVVLYGGHLNEILHLGRRNGQDGVFAAFCQPIGHVVQGLKFFSCHFQLRQPFLGGIGEYEAVNGGDEPFLYIPIVGLVIHISQWQEIFDSFGIKLLFETEHSLLAPVGDAQGIP